MSRRWYVQVRADSCIYMLSLGPTWSYRKLVGCACRDDPKTRTRFENVNGRNIARGEAFPVVNGYPCRHVVWCYSFPWCTSIEIRNVQPIRNIAGANASRYREGSGHCILAVRCNFWSSSALESAPECLPVSDAHGAVSGSYVWFRIRGALG